MANIARLVLGVIFLVTARASAAADFLRDPADPASWTFELHEGAAGTFTRDGGALKVQVTRPGTAAWHVQLYQSGLNLKPGGKYTVRFRAKSDAPRTYVVHTGIDVPDYHPVSDPMPFRTTTSWSSITLTFTARDVVPDHVRAPTFALGETTGTLWLDDVVLQGPSPEGAAAVIPSNYFAFTLPWDDTTTGVATDVSFLNEKPADRRIADRQHFDPKQLDKLDYLIAKLKEQGIYVNINLKVSKELTPADGMPESIKDVPFVHQKRIDYFVRRMVDLQKDYAQKLLTHVNPYTKQSYTDDPAVAFVEINNENALLGYWTRTLGVGLDALPEEFKHELEHRWITWLKHKYRVDDSIRAAWNTDAAKVGESIIAPKTPWTNEAHEAAKVVTAVNGDEVAADVQAVTGTDWHVQVHRAGLSVKKGQTYTLLFQIRADKARSVRVGVTKDIADWSNLGLGTNLQAMTQYKPHTMVFTATADVVDHARVGFALGSTTGRVWIKDLELRPGVVGAGLASEQSLSAGNIPIPRTTTKQQGEDWIQFLIDTERAYADEMLGYLKNDLKLKANVALTQIDYGGIGGLVREHQMDFADAHAYWQHPAFPGGMWDAANWTIENSPQVNAMTGADFGSLGALAVVRVAGKPFTVSEYDHPAPSDYMAEMLPQVATFGCVQDWDGIYTFAMSTYSAEAKPNRILGFFDQNNNPAKWAFYPTAALIFRRELVRPAPVSATLELPEPIQSTAHMFDDAWRAGFGNGSTFDMLNQRLGVSDDPIDAKKQARVNRTGSGKSQVEVRTTPNGKVYVAAAPAVAVLSGFVGGGMNDAGDLSADVKAFGNNFATITAVATDGKPIAQSDKVLVTVCGRVENQGMRWNDKRTTVGTGWGKGPTIAEHVPATLSLQMSAGSKVYALDGTGKRKGEVPSKTQNGRLTFDVRQQDATLWYEVAR
jgi:hypothetical protein